MSFLPPLADIPGEAALWEACGVLETASRGLEVIMSGGFHRNARVFSMKRNIWTQLGELLSTEVIDLNTVPLKKVIV